MQLAKYSTQPDSMPPSRLTASRRLRAEAAAEPLRRTLDSTPAQHVTHTQPLKHAVLALWQRLPSQVYHVQHLAHVTAGAQLTRLTCTPAV